MSFLGTTNVAWNTMLVGHFYHCIATVHLKIYNFYGNFLKNYTCSWTTNPSKTLFFAVLKYQHSKIIFIYQIISA